MSTDDLSAALPALSSQKGTPVRLFFELESGDKLVVEPLRYNAGGLVLKAAGIADLVPGVAEELPSFALLGHDGKVAKEFPVSADAITSIEAFVIYPNGATWEGRIFEGKENDLRMLIWSWELGHRLHIEDKEKIFGLNLAWPDVPTTVGVLSHQAVAGCPWIEHSCPKQCDARTKVF